MTLRSTIRRHWRNLPFAQKLAGLLIALVSLPIVIVVLFTSYTSQEALIAASRARNLERAQATAQVLEAYFNDARADVRTASALSSVVDLCERPGDTDLYQRALRSLKRIRREQGMLAMFVTDPCGACGTDHGPARPDRVAADGACGPQRYRRKDGR